MAEFVVVSLFCQIVLLNFLENFCIVLHYIAPLLLFFFFFCFGSASSLDARTRCPRKWSLKTTMNYFVLFCSVRFGLVLFSSVLFCFVLFAQLPLMCCNLAWFGLMDPTSNKNVVSLTSYCNRKLTEQFFINPSLILHPVKVCPYSLPLSLYPAQKHVKNLIKNSLTTVKFECTAKCLVHYDMILSRKVI